MCACVFRYVFFSVRACVRLRAHAYVFFVFTGACAFLFVRLSARSIRCLICSKLVSVMIIIG